jgi:hypothetical protein
MSTADLGLEADHSHPSSAEVKNAWGYTSTPPYVVMVQYLVKHRDNFTIPIIRNYLSLILQYKILAVFSFLVSLFILFEKLRRRSIY